MSRKLPPRKLRKRSRVEVSEQGHPMSITTKHRLLTGSWAADVDALESAIGLFKSDSPRANDCQVVFFEIFGDAHLHVNVTHKHPTMSVSGWAGPASLPNGFVHNRIFGDMQPKEMIRHIREMVFAGRDWSERPAGTAGA